MIRTRFSHQRSDTRQGIGGYPGVVTTVSSHILRLFHANEWLEDNGMMTMSNPKQPTENYGM